MDLNGVVAVVLALLTCAPWRIYSQERLLVPMTLVRNASALGACKKLIAFSFCFLTSQRPREDLFLLSFV